MPCMDNRIPGREDYADYYLYRGKAAELLCSLLQKVENNGMIDIVPQDILDWWKEHKEIDKLRLISKLREEKEEADKQELIDKLTPYEKKLLNIK